MVYWVVVLFYGDLVELPLEKYEIFMMILSLLLGALCYVLSRICSGNLVGYSLWLLLRSI